ncbi:relaxase/mobilization nuclease domain-containing protein [Methylotenera sp. 1P/1]|uniref:relaxase/mobilization nuclease domain-containing protein n=1 Tax=Methylotenera sp. 1P/1 TaxID=1131551 RepID=UPI0003814F7E|nr:relaxase/mobilization nuclease domain-containing protein [Methylotenera sp. 1P/1]
MIVRIFKSGVSNGESPVKYLLGNTDHTGNQRAVKPEVLEGNPQTTIDVINSIQRKYKYISGCISFRDSEKPTRSQLYEIIDDFKKTFCPKLNGDNFNSLFVLHQDKGNIEVHFVFANQELKSNRRFNIHPPGKQNIQFFESFVKVTNQKLGYAQVIPDPLKIAFTDFERKTPEGRKDKSNKRWIQQSIIKAIQKGDIKNRDDLCKHLDENLGVTVTRQGKDYLSVKLPGALKAKRLRGALYSEDASYQELIKQSIASKQPYYLSPSEFKAEQIKLNDYIQAREQFNIKAYLTPRPMRRFAKQINPTLTTTTRRMKMAKKDYLPIIKRIIREALMATRIKPTPKNLVIAMPDMKTTMSNVASIRSKALGVTKSPETLDLDALKMTIAEVETNMHKAIGEMSNTKNPIEAAKLQQRVIQLKIQLEKLYAEMRAIQIKFGLSVSFPKPK